MRGARVMEQCSNMRAASRKEGQAVWIVAHSPRSTLAQRREATVAEPSARRSFELLATIFPQSNKEGAPKDICPVLFIFDPEGEVQPIAEIITQCYDLTAAETKIAIMLMQGFTLKETSVTLGITKETARKQLQSVFWKTNTNRQSELILLLIRGTANLRLWTFFVNSKTITCPFWGMTTLAVYLKMPMYWKNIGT